MLFSRPTVHDSHFYKNGQAEQIVREGKLESNPAKLVATPKIERKLPNHLSMEDAVRFIETPDTTMDLGRRDRAIRSRS